MSLNPLFHTGLLSVSFATDPLINPKTDTFLGPFESNLTIGKTVLNN